MSIDEFTINFYHSDDGEKIPTWMVQMVFNINYETYEAEYHFFDKPESKELKGVVKLLMNHAVKFAEEGEEK